MPAKPSVHPARFVVHEHRATRLHYDFRLEIGGVLKSWAVPKGPSMNAADKRLALQVEDHPLVYHDFEGIIPEGMYGAGPVVVWDCGTFEPAEPGPAEGRLAAGKFSFVLHGKKLRGQFTLTRFAGGRTEREWLLIKNKDGYADPRWTLQTELTPARLKRLETRTPPCESS